MPPARCKMSVPPLCLLVLLITVTAKENSAEYVFGFPSNFGGHSTYMRLIVTSTASDEVTVRSSNQVVFSSHVSAGSSTIVNIPSQLMVNTSEYSERHKGIHVTSTKRGLSIVAVCHYQLSATASSTTSFKILPYQKLAAKKYYYYAMTTDSITDKFSSEILLVAYEDNTEIRITSQSPDVLLRLPTNVQMQNSAWKLGTSHKVMLHRMQTLLIKDASHDLTGTLISANNQLAVISGHECGNVPADTDNCDNVVVQVPPTFSWGNEYLLFPMTGRQAGQNYKIVASRVGTSVSLYCEGSNTDFSLLTKGSYHELHTLSNELCSLISDKPVLVALLGLGFATDSKGDPSMVVIPPISEFKASDVLFQSLNTTEFKSQYLSIVVPASDDYKQFQLNSANLFSFYWKKIPGPSSTPMGYLFNRDMLPYQLNSLTSKNSGSHFATFMYGSDSTLKHSFCYSVTADDEEWPSTVSIVSLHHAHYLELEASQSLTIGLGRVGITDTSLNVQVSIEGTTSSSEYSSALAAELHSDFEIKDTVVSFAPGEIDKTLEIDMLDDTWTEPVKAIKVSLLPSIGMEIIGYRETVISILDNDGIVIKASSEFNDFTNEIIVMVEITGGQLLPGIGFPILVEVFFPEDPASGIMSTHLELSSNHTLQVVSFDLASVDHGLVTLAIMEIEADLLADSKIPYIIETGQTEITIAPAPMPATSLASNGITSISSLQTTSTARTESAAIITLLPMLSATSNASHSISESAPSKPVTIQYDPQTILPLLPSLQYTNPLSPSSSVHPSPTPLSLSSSVHPSPTPLSLSSSVHTSLTPLSLSSSVHPSPTPLSLSSSVHPSTTPPSLSSSVHPSPTPLQSTPPPQEQGPCSLLLTTGALPSPESSPNAFSVVNSSYQIKSMGSLSQFLSPTISVFSPLNARKSSWSSLLVPTGTPVSASFPHYFTTSQYKQGSPSLSSPSLLPSSIPPPLLSLPPLSLPSPSLLSPSLSPPSPLLPPLSLPSLSLPSPSLSSPSLSSLSLSPPSLSSPSLPPPSPPPLPSLSSSSLPLLSQPPPSLPPLSLSPLSSPLLPMYSTTSQKLPLQSTLSLNSTSHDSQSPSLLSLQTTHTTISYGQDVSSPSLLSPSPLSLPILTVTASFHQYESPSLLSLPTYTTATAQYTYGSLSPSSSLLSLSPPSPSTSPPTHTTTTTYPLPSFPPSPLSSEKAVLSAILPSSLQPLFRTTPHSVAETPTPTFTQTETHAFRSCTNATEMSECPSAPHDKTSTSLYSTSIIAVNPVISSFSLELSSPSNGHLQHPSSVASTVEQPTLVWQPGLSSSQQSLQLSEHPPEPTQPVPSVTQHSPQSSQYQSITDSSPFFSLPSPIISEYLSHMMSSITEPPLQLTSLPVEVNPKYPSTDLPIAVTEPLLQSSSPNLPITAELLQPSPSELPVSKPPQHTPSQNSYYSIQEEPSVIPLSPKDSPSIASPDKGSLLPSGVKSTTSIVLVSLPPSEAAVSAPIPYLLLIIVVGVVVMTITIACIIATIITTVMVVHRRRKVGSWSPTFNAPVVLLRRSYIDSETPSPPDI